MNTGFLTPSVVCLAQPWWDDYTNEEIAYHEDIKMKRREFLKLIGISSAFVAAPALAYSPTEEGKMMEEKLLDKKRLVASHDVKHRKRASA